MAGTLGLDLGIRTGSLVKIEINPKYKLLSHSEVLFSWTDGPSMSTSLTSICQFFEENVYPHISFENGGYIGVDWNLAEIHWGGNKKNASIKTFVAGQLYRECQRENVACVFVSPRYVRSFFGFNSQVGKFDVQRKFLSLPTISEYQYHVLDDGMTEHDIDALILAYILGHKLS